MCYLSAVWIDHVMSEVKPRGVRLQQFRGRNFLAVREHQRRQREYQKHHTADDCHRFDADFRRN